jgi:hypothetical protein
MRWDAQHRLIMAVDIFQGLGVDPQPENHQ